MMARAARSVRVSSVRLRCRNPISSSAAVVRAEIRMNSQPRISLRVGSSKISHPLVRIPSEPASQSMPAMARSDDGGYWNLRC